MSKMNAKHIWVMVLASATLGLSMPSCPGQQAMQGQLDTLQAQTSDQAKKIQKLQSQVDMLNTEVGKIKEVLSQATATIEAHQAAVKQMEEAIKALQSMPPARSQSSARPSKSKPQRRR